MVNENYFNSSSMDLSVPVTSGVRRPKQAAKRSLVTMKAVSAGVTEFERKSDMEKV